MLIYYFKLNLEEDLSQINFLFDPFKVSLKLSLLCNPEIANCRKLWKKRLQDLLIFDFYKRIKKNVKKLF